MSKEQIKDFLLELKTSTDLQQKLKAGNVTDEPAFIKVANDAGFDFTAEEWKEYARQVNESKNVKLNDDELDNVSAGWLFGLIDNCPKRKSQFYCVDSFCPKLGLREKWRDTYTITYCYCTLGYWDDEKDGFEYTFF